jgi:hypothetical protein
MRTVFVGLAAALGGAAGVFLFLKYGKGKKCKCSEAAAPAPAAAASEEVPISQPINATAAVAMNMDGWNSPY